MCGCERVGDPTPSPREGFIEIGEIGAVQNRRIDAADVVIADLETGCQRREACRTNRTVNWDKRRMTRT